MNRSTHTVVITAALLLIPLAAATGMATETVHLPVDHRVTPETLDASIELCNTTCFHAEVTRITYSSNGVLELEVAGPAGSYAGNITVTTENTTRSYGHPITLRAANVENQVTPFLTGRFIMGESRSFLTAVLLSLIGGAVLWWKRGSIGKTWKTRLVSGLVVGCAVFTTAAPVLHEALHAAALAVFSCPYTVQLGSVWGPHTVAAGACSLAAWQAGVFLSAGVFGNIAGFAAALWVGRRFKTYRFLFTAAAIGFLLPGLLSLLGSWGDGAVIHAVFPSLPPIMPLAAGILFFSALFFLTDTHT